MGIVILASPRIGFIYNNDGDLVNTVTGAGNFVGGAFKPGLFDPNTSSGIALGGGLLPT
ncbi:hypothetical protein IKE96_00885 [bacterium]|nr:hypothetical protein [bacterium]